MFDKVLFYYSKVYVNKKRMALVRLMQMRLSKFFRRMLRIVKPLISYGKNWYKRQMWIKMGGLTLKNLY